MSIEFTDALVIGSIGVILLTWLLSEIECLINKNKKSNIDDIYDSLD